VAACSLAPAYHRPATAPAPVAYREASGWKLATPADTEPRRPWWSVFHDTTLNSLESQVTDANQDLKAAFARLQEARAQSRIAQAGQFPLVTADGSAARTHASLTSPSYNSSLPTTYDDYSGGVALSYEIDLFGRVRNTVAAARATEQATAGDVAALDLSVRAELAGDYLQLRGLDAQQELLDRTVADYRRALQLTEALYGGGLADRSDVQQAKAQLESARTEAEDSRLRRAQTEHAIATLVGEQASDFQLAPQPLPAASGPQGLLTLFDGGLRRAQSSAATAAYDAQVAGYRGSVLTAFQEVEDNLAALRQLERESVSQAAAVTATRAALELANHRYRSGLVTYLEVVSTENAALAANIAAVNIHTRQLTASVLLIKALGGGWGAGEIDKEVRADSSHAGR